MAWRFRRSFKILPGVKLNVSKRGFGASVGVKGARVGISPGGRTYTSASIPGTGLYAINYAAAGRRRTPASGGEGSTALGCVAVLLLALMTVVFVQWPVFGGFLLAGAAGVYYAYRQTPAQKLKRKLAKAAPLLSTQEYSAALSVLKEAEQIQPGNPSVRYLIAGVLNNTEQFDQAVRYLEPLYRERAADEDVSMLLANGYFRTQRFDDAIPIVQKIPPDSPWHVKAVSILGGCFCEQKKYDLAIEAWKNAPLHKRKFDEDLKEIHYNLAEAYNELGNKKKAKRHLERIAAQDAEYRDVREKLEALEA